MSSNWSMSEDVQLCISYCRQTLDPISGAKQKVDKLWEKIYTDLHANWSRGRDEVIITDDVRSQTALASRFAKLKPNLNLWGSCISYAKRNPESGSNLQDEVRKAQVMYVAKRKRTFIHFECWEQVKMHPTFAPNDPITPPIYTQEETPIAQEVPTNDSYFDVSFVDPFSTPESNPRSSSSPVRPQGVKAAKEARRKGKKVSGNTESYNDTLKIIAENQTKQLAIQQAQIELAQKQMAHTHKMQERAANDKRLADETNVMQLDTSLMTPNSKKYFSKRKAIIMQRYNEEDEDNTDEGNYSGNFTDYYRPNHDD